MLVGLLSDTHLPGAVRSLDDLGPEPARFFSSVDLILHAGDVTSPVVLDWLEQYAPVVCATGNNDSFQDPRSREVQVLELEGWHIGLVHSLRRHARPVPALQKIFATPVDIMVWGHSHRERLEFRDGVVLLNSGSATLPDQKGLRLGTVGLLELERAGSAPGPAAGPYSWKAEPGYGYGPGVHPSQPLSWLKGTNPGGSEWLRFHGAAAALLGFKEPMGILDVKVHDTVEHGAILVKTTSASICASDVHAWQGGVGGGRERCVPRILGQEMTGRTARLGPGGGPKTRWASRQGTIVGRGE